MKEKESIWPTPSQITPDGKKAYGITDMFDTMIMTTYQINEDQYDWILNQMCDEEMNIIVDIFGPEPATFTQKRKAFSLINEYKEKYKRVHAEEK